jgi:hypothetical protein
MRDEALEFKAGWIFEQAFSARGWLWAGPEFDFDRDSYKARIDSGPLRGLVRYLSCERLGSMDTSANDLDEPPQRNN